MPDARDEDKLIDYDGLTSLPAAFFARAAEAPDTPMLWAKRDGAWQPLTRGEVARMVRDLARGLIALGLRMEERVILVAENRPEFLVADLAIMTAGGITVPAYTTNTEADHAHILEDSEAAMVVVSTKALARRLLPPAVRAPDCRAAIVMEDASDVPAGAFPVHRWEEVLAMGAQRPDGIDGAMASLGRDDVACFIYTSGTGGLPKGVMLTHGNIIANCEMAYRLLRGMSVRGSAEIFLSFLPLSHAYEHTAGQFFPVTIGAQIYYSRGVEQLSTELAEVRPTIMTAVPRLYEMLHQRILAGLRKASRPRRWLFHKGLDLGRRRYEGQRLAPWDRVLDLVLDRLVRNKVRGRFGGRLKGMVSGGAALNPEIGIFFTALGLRILQGYGQTEAAPVIACNPPRKVKLHTVGPPLHRCEVKLAPDGELLVRGPHVMKGYWRMPEHTAETIKDGWLHTGDLAHIDAEGYIQITDRKKDIVVLSGGDTLSPARVEGILTRQPEISQAMVHGDKRPHLVALIVPDDSFVQGWAKENGKAHDLAELAEDRAFRAAMDDVVQRVNRELSPVEKIRRFRLSPEPFTVENEMMTPTLKIRRHKIKAVYGQHLESLY